MQTIRPGGPSPGPHPSAPEGPGGPDPSEADRLTDRQGGVAVTATFEAAPGLGQAEAGGSGSEGI